MKAYQSQHTRKWMEANPLKSVVKTGEKMAKVPLTFSKNKKYELVFVKNDFLQFSEVTSMTWYVCTGFLHHIPSFV